MEIPLAESERYQILLSQLAEQNSESDDLVRDFRSFIGQYQLLSGPPNLDQDHPLEEVGWLLLAVLLHHHGIAAEVFLKVPQFAEMDAPPVEILPFFKAIQKCKWQLFQERQKLDQSHKEVCSPVIEKCR